MFITSGYVITGIFVIAILFHLIKFDYKKQKMTGLISSIIAVTVHAYIAYWVYTATTLLK